MTGLPPAAVKMRVRSRFIFLFCSVWAKRNQFNIYLCRHFFFYFCNMSPVFHTGWNESLLQQSTPFCLPGNPPGNCMGGKKCACVCVCVKDIYILLPACVSSRDGDEWRGAKRQCCGSWRYRDRVWLGLAFAVVLFRLSEGQRRQLDRPTRHPPNQEGLHAGDWLWGAGGVVGYLGRSQGIGWMSRGWKKGVKNMFTGCKMVLY